MNNSELTNEQVVMLQLRIMSALSFYRQRPEKEAKNMADLLMLCGAAASELQERRKADSEPVPWKWRLLAYADSYRSMAMQGVESIPIWSVITDLERNIAPLYTYTPAPVEQSPEIIDYEHRMICGELRPVPKFRVEETYHNILKEEQEVNAKLAEYSLNENQPQATPESEDRKMLKRLAVIMSGSDSGGEISALTVTAQSLVDRCKALAREKENSHIQWKPASPDEINKRSVREPGLQHTDTFPPAKGPQIPPMASRQVVHIALHSPKLPEPSSREAIIAGGVLVQCPRCHGDSYRINFNGWVHHWCDKCANAISSEDK